MEGKTNEFFIVATLEEPIYCSNCGKNMVDEEGTSNIAVRLRSADDGSSSIKAEEARKFLKLQYGKYYGRNMDFCWECYFDSLTRNTKVK